MDILNQVSQKMQELLLQKANDFAKDLGFIQRERKLTGSLFTRILVFSWLSNPQASLEDFSQTAQSLSLSLTPQAIDSRFTPESMALLKTLLEEAMTSVLASQTSTFPLLARFNGVYLQDSSVLSLPKELASLFPGGANQHSSEIAGVKMSLRWNWSQGELTALELMPSKNSDQSAFAQEERLPKGSLKLADLGYFNLGQFKKSGEEGSYWLSRYHEGRMVLDEEGNEIDLLRVLKKEKNQSFEMKVKLGKEAKLEARMIVEKVPPEVLRKRRERLKKEAKKNNVPSISEAGS